MIQRDCNWKLVIEFTSDGATWTPLKNDHPGSCEQVVLGATETIRGVLHKTGGDARTVRVYPDGTREVLDGER